jgi:hypothetical protein
LISLCFCFFVYFVSQHLLLSLLCLLFISMFILFLCVYFISLFDFHISSICTNNIIVMLIRIFFFSFYYLFPVVCLSPIVCLSICVSVSRHPLCLCIFLSVYITVCLSFCQYMLLYVYFLPVYVTVCLCFSYVCFFVLVSQVLIVFENAKQGRGRRR